MHLKLLLLAAVLVTGAIVWVVLPTDQEKIEARFAELIEVVNQEKPADAFGKLERLQRFKALFTSTVYFHAVDLPLQETVTNEELTRFFFSLAERADTVSLRHEALEFLLIADKRAEVKTHFHGEARMPDGKLYTSENTLKATLAEVEGEWTFNEFQALETSRPEVD